MCDFTQSLAEIWFELYCLNTKQCDTLTHQTSSVIKTCFSACWASSKLSVRRKKKTTKKISLHSSHLLHFLVFQTILWDVAVFTAVIVWSRLCREQLISLAKGTETSFNHWPISELLSFWILLPIGSVSFIPPSFQVTNQSSHILLVPSSLPASSITSLWYPGGIFQPSAPYHWNLPVPEPECASNH